MKVIVKFLTILFVLQYAQHIFSQETLFPKGRTWHLLCKHQNPYAPSYVFACVADSNIMIDGKQYTYIAHDGYYRKDGTKLYTRTFHGRDALVFDESWEVGDTTTWLYYKGFNEETMECYTVYETVTGIGYINGLKYWNLDFDGSELTFLEGVGYINSGRAIFSYCSETQEPEEDWITVEGSYELICCIDPGNDTLYVNRDLLYMLETGVENISASEVSFTQQGSECIVTLPADVAWSATLSNSVGVTVARRSGEGSEITLPATSKGTHILVVNVGGRVVKKKVFIK
jgi:hypothetical protein